MNKKRRFLMGKLWIAPLLLAILLTFCGDSTGPDISDYEIYYFNSSNFDVAADSTGLLIIIFRNASGEDDEIRTAMPSEDITLYDENGYTLTIWESGGIYYIYPVMGGSIAYAVSTEGIVAEHEKHVSENTYMVHFIDSTTGDIDYTAEIVETEGEEFLAIFRAPVNDTVEVDVISYFTNTMYSFEFDNEAGAGAVEFRTDAEGYIFLVALW